MSGVTADIGDYREREGERETERKMTKLNPDRSRSIPLDFTRSSPSHLSLAAVVKAQFQKALGA